MESLIIKDPMLHYNKQLQLVPVDKVSWSPGGLRRLPWFGVIPLLLSIICTGIAVGVVLKSDNGLEKDWSGLRQPGVLLAYTSTLANSLMGLAFAQAAVIFFWVQVATPIPVSNLHYNWAGSLSIMGALTSLRHGRAIRISLVSILVATTGLLRGPLIQRASSVQVVEVSVNKTMDIWIAEQISSHWAGKKGRLTEANNTSQFSPEFSDVVRDFLDKKPIRLSGVHCENCTLAIKAFGFNVTNCTETTSLQYDFEPSHVLSAQNSDHDSWKRPIFQSSITLIRDPISADPSDEIYCVLLNVTTRRKALPGCNGTFTDHTCLVNPSTMRYNLHLQGDIATFRSNSWEDDSYVGPSYIHNAVAEYDRGITDLPLWQVGNSLFGSSAWIVYDNQSFSEMYNEGLIANLYSGNWSSAEASRDDDPCYEYFNDPMDYILNSYREIGFRIAVRAALHSTYNEFGQLLPDTIQSGVPYTSHLIQVRYAAHIRSLILAVIVSLTGPLATLSLFWGWWKLGRDFSMSPLEFTNAILQQERSNLEISSQERISVRDASPAESATNNHGTAAEYEANDGASEAATATIRSGISTIGYSEHRQELRNHQQLADVFSSCSTNLTANKLAKHFRRRGQTKNHGGGDEEPKVQYGVLESGAEECLGFAVVSSDTQGPAVVRQPRKGELL